MTATRGTRIFGMMMLFAIVVSVLAGQSEYAGLATLLAIITGGHIGEAWHRWRTGS